MKRKIKNVLVCGLISLILIFQITLSLAADTSKVIVETARLREEATQDSRVLELLSQGDEVEILSQSGDWYQVRFNGITGYLRGDLLDVSQDSSSSSENGDSNVDNNTSSTDNTSSEENNTSAENTSNTDNNSNTNTSTGDSSVENTNSTSDTTSTENTNSTGENVGSEATTNQNSNELTEDEKNSTYEVMYITNLKIVPLINALDTATLEAKTQVKLLEKMNGWVNISNDEYQGWVREDQIQKVQSETNTEQEAQGEQNEGEQAEQTEQSNEQETQSNIMYVNAQTVNVRSRADKSSEAITQVTINTAVEVISEEGGWSHIRVDGIEGYIATNLLSSTRQTSSRSMTTSRTENSEESNASENQSTGSSTDVDNSKNEESNDTTSSSDSSNNSSSSKGSEVASYAMSFIGKPYKYGGSSPSGFDCSGFTSYVYKYFGVTLNRTASSQAQNGTKVSRSDLQLGDLIMFCSPINHVGIYIGGGKIVHAANPSRGVTTDTILSGYYNTNYNCARRIF